MPIVLSFEKVSVKRMLVIWHLVDDRELRICSRFWRRKSSRAR